MEQRVSVQAKSLNFQDSSQFDKTQSYVQRNRERPSFFVKSLSEKPPNALEVAHPWFFITFLVWIFSLGIIIAMCYWFPENNVQKYWKYLFIPLGIQLSSLLLAYAMNLKTGLFEHKNLGYIMWIGWILGFLLTVCSILIAIYAKPDPLGYFTDLEKEKWTEMWNLIPTKNAYSPPHIPIFLDPSRNLGNRTIFLDELIAIRLYNVQLGVPAKTAYLVLCFVLMAIMLSTGRNITEKYEKHQFQCCELRTDWSLERLYRDAEAEAEKRIVMSKRRLIFLFFGGCVIVAFYSLITHILPKTETGLANEHRHLSLYGSTATGGPFWESTFTLPLFPAVIVLYLSLISPLFSGIILYIACYVETRSLMETIRFLEQFVYSLFGDESFMRTEVCEVKADQDEIKTLCQKNPVKWIHLRHSVRNYLISMSIRRMQWGVFVLFAIAFSLLTYVGIVMATTGTLGWGVSGPWTIVASPLLIFAASRILLLLTDAHQVHVDQLKNVEIWLKSYFMRQKNENKEMLEVEGIILLVESLVDLDRPFEIFSFPITKNLFRTITGYFLSMLTFVLTSLFNKYFG